jgi:hypothetical protein
MTEIDRDSRPSGPNPWSWENFEVRDKFGCKVATASTHSNARRIAACANACASVSTEELERGIIAELVFRCGNIKGDETVAGIVNRLRPAR